MSIPDYQTLILPVLTVAAEGETCAPVVVDRVPDLFELSSRGQ